MTAYAVFVALQDVYRGGTQQLHAAADLQGLPQGLLHHRILNDVPQGIFPQFRGIEMDPAFTAGIPDLHLAERTDAARRHARPGP